MTSIAMLFPGNVVTSETEEPGDLSDLLPSERRFISHTAPSRISDFAAGRRCARQAISRLGLKDFELPVNADRTARWPPGLVGSITHTDGYCAVAVSKRARYAGIGLDVEWSSAVPLSVVPQICTDAEQACINALPGEAGAKLATLIFTTKECFYKCQYCVTRTWLDFKEVEVQIRAGQFVVTSTHPVVQHLQRKWSMRGKFMWHAGRVASGMVLER